MAELDLERCPWCGGELEKQWVDRELFLACECGYGRNARWVAQDHALAQHARAEAAEQALAGLIELCEPFRDLIDGMDREDVGVNDPLLEMTLDPDRPERYEPTIGDLIALVGAICPDWAPWRGDAATEADDA